MFVRKEWTKEMGITKFHLLRPSKHTTDRLSFVCTPWRSDERWSQRINYRHHSCRTRSIFVRSSDHLSCWQDISLTNLNLAGKFEKASRLFLRLNFYLVKDHSFASHSDGEYEKAFLVRVTHVCLCCPNNLINDVEESLHCEATPRKAISGDLKARWAACSLTISFFVITLTLWFYAKQYFLD